MALAFAGVHRAAVERMLAELATMKENLRHANAQRAVAGPAGERFLALRQNKKERRS